MTIRQGVDVEKLNSFRTFMEENPEKAQLGLEVKAIYEGQAGRSTVHIGKFSIDGETIDRETRHYTIPFGAWREVEELQGVEAPPTAWSRWRWRSQQPRPAWSTR